MIKLLVALTLCGHVSIDKEGYLQQCKNNCILEYTMPYILNSDPKYWKKRFKRALRADYVPPIGYSLYSLPKKEIKRIIEEARLYGIELE